MPSAENPYDPKTQPNLYKMWERREKARRAKEAEKAKESEKSEDLAPDDKSKRRRQLDDAIEGATAKRVGRMRKGQFSDSNNKGNYV